jgi:hypothetical protein
MVKKLFISMMTFLMVAVPTLAMAGGERAPTVALPQKAAALSEEDALALLKEAMDGESNHLLQVAVLSVEEMQETEGEGYILYAAGLAVARGLMWAAPRLSSAFRVYTNSKTAHTVLKQVTSTGQRHIAQIAGGKNPHVAFGANLKNSNVARWHIFKNKK